MSELQKPLDPSTKSEDKTIGFKKEQQETARQEDLRRLKAADDLLAKILEQVHYIGKLKAEQIEVAPVENIKEKIEKAQRKLYDYLNRPEQTAEQNQSLGAEQQQTPGDNIPIEKHPLLQDMGGMPLELDNIDQEFLKDLGVENTLDKSELQNQIKKKLENKLKMLNKLQAEIKHKVKNQPAYKPVQKQVNELVIKYKMTLDDLKNKPVLQPEPELKYQPAPKWTPPTPRPD